MTQASEILITLLSPPPRPYNLTTDQAACDLQQLVPCHRYPTDTRPYQLACGIIALYPTSTR